MVSSGHSVKNIFTQHIFYVLLCLLVAATLSLNHAQAQSLEVIPLQHRLVEQVLPVLQPLVEPGGSLSGFNNQLFLRTSPQNSAEIRQALAAIDTPMRQLVIWVATDREMLNDSRGVDVTVTERGRQINTRLHDTRTQRTGRATQRVQTIDGGRAFIHAGVSLAVPLQRIQTVQGRPVVQESLEFRDIGQGFFAEPRVVGNQVTIAISQQADTLRQQGMPGSADVQRLSTEVSGRLGEWISLGSIAQQSDGRSRENISLSRHATRSDQDIWLKVEALP